MVFDIIDEVSKSNEDTLFERLDHESFVKLQANQHELLTVHETFGKASIDL